MAETTQSVAESLKLAGNAAVAEGKVEQAASLYTQAIQLDPANHVLFSNRSAAFLSLGRAQLSLHDANNSVRLSEGKWMKAHFRRAQALIALKKLPEARDALTTALSLEPANEQLKTAMENVKKDLKAQELSGLLGDLDSDNEDTKNNQHSNTPDSKPTNKRKASVRFSEDSKAGSSGVNAAHKELSGMFDSAEFMAPPQQNRKKQARVAQSASVMQAHEMVSRANASSLQSLVSSLLTEHPDLAQTITLHLATTSLPSQQAKRKNKRQMQNDSDDDGDEGMMVGKDNSSDSEGVGGEIGGGRGKVQWSCSGILSDDDVSD